VLRRLLLVTTASAAALTFAGVAQAAGGTGMVGAFNKSDSAGFYQARVTAAFTPDDSAPWTVVAYTVPLGDACVVNTAETVYASDSMTGSGSVADVVEVDPVEDGSVTVCLYAHYGNQSYLLAQGNFKAPALAAPPRPRQERIPTLSRGQAWGYTTTVLNRRFSDTWDHRAGGWIKCGRITRTRMRCRVAWAIGDSSYYGLVRVWRERDSDGEPQAYYSYRIRYLDEYCAVTGGTNCSRVYTN
jgi:hypothetical protein